MNTHWSKMISIVIPIFNESESISLFLDEVRKQILKLKENFEIICVDDGSTDITLELLKKHKEKYREIKIIKLSRNFGKEIALSCGLDYAKGDIVIIMDADFQHPVSLILELYEAHKAQDCEVVLAKRINRQKENFINKSLAYLFYRIHNKISKVQIPYNVGDCRLISKKVLEQIKNFHETQRFMKGVFAYVGFKTYTIEYEAEERKYGKSNFNIWKLWNLALEGITSFSIVPLRIFYTLEL